MLLNANLKSSYTWAQRFRKRKTGVRYSATTRTGAGESHFRVKYVLKREKYYRRSSL